MDMIACLIFMTANFFLSSSSSPAANVTGPDGSDLGSTASLVAAAAAAQRSSCDSLLPVPTGICIRSAAIGPVPVPVPAPAAGVLLGDEFAPASWSLSALLLDDDLLTGLTGLAASSVTTICGTGSVSTSTSPGDGNKANSDFLRDPEIDIVTKKTP